MKTAVLLFMLGLACCPRAGAQEAFFEFIRGRAATLPVLEPSGEAGSPKFTVVRFNAPPILAAGERYGAIRVIFPPDKPRSLAWLFSDTTNINEYGLLTSTGVRLDAASSRFIHPATASADVEQERPGRPASSLPRPWDVFQLHVLGVPAHALKPGGEYIIWFRFSDQRPTDLLLAATFLDPMAKLGPAELPPVFGLPLWELP